MMTMVTKAQVGFYYDGLQSVRGSHVSWQLRKTHGGIGHKLPKAESWEPRQGSPGRAGDGGRSCQAAVKPRRS